MCRGEANNREIGLVPEAREIGLSELEWFDGYNGESTEALLALEGKYRTDSLVVAFDQALQQKEFHKGADSLTEEELVVLAIEALENEVNNGGYDQLFRNSPEYAHLIVTAFEQIGCDDVATLTEEALTKLGIKGPISQSAVEQAMDTDDSARDDALVACDERYFEIAGDLAGPLLELIKKHKDKIKIGD